MSADPFSVTCPRPTCRAKSPDLCVSPAGDLLGHPHPERARLAEMTESEGCPDGGTCHHGCSVGCFRVKYAGPFSNTYPNDRWPADIVAANNALRHGDHMTASVLEGGVIEPQES